MAAKFDERMPNDDDDEKKELSKWGDPSLIRLGFGLNSDSTGRSSKLEDALAFYRQLAKLEQPDKSSVRRSFGTVSIVDRGRPAWCST